jgi:hypothetical protein
MNSRDVNFNWKVSDMLEVTLPEPDNFLKIKETLTRIGIASKQSKKLYQSCHILHKQGHYFIVNFKELFALDGREANITVSDIERRNVIANLLEDWGLLSIVDKNKINIQGNMSQIKVISFADKHNWTLIPKYTIGKKIEE